MTAAGTATVTARRRGHPCVVTSNRGGTAQAAEPTSTAFANDLTDNRTLAAVTDNVNSSKSDRDPAYWLPPNTNDTCRYIGAWIAIKTRWQLTIDTAETTALNDLITGQCSGLAITP